jgi:hypothetical protein
VNLFGKEKLTLAQLKKEVKKAKVDSKTKYRISRKLHKSWPSNPNRYEGWVSWQDLFGREGTGAGRPRNTQALKYSKLRRVVKREKISSQRHYDKAQKKHSPAWPSNPDRYYGEEWVSWWDFLGKKKKGE